MVSQERFDGLARGLATGRLTRWQVLKGLGAGVLLGSAGLLRPWSARFAEAQTRAGKSAPVGSISDPRLDPVEPHHSDLYDSCVGFNHYLTHTGVTDEKGKNWPGLAGVTSYKADFKAEKWHWKPFECKNKNDVCVQTTDSQGKPAKVKVTFTALGPVTVVDWRPPPDEPFYNTCADEEDKFMNAVVAHEQRHVNDIEKIVAEANSSWRRKPRFTASAPRKAGKQSRQKALEKAHANLQQKIEKAELDQCDSITSEIKTRGANFDANAPEIHPLDCTECGFCDSATTRKGGVPPNEWRDYCCDPSYVCCNHPDGSGYICCSSTCCTPVHHAICGCGAPPL